MEKHEHEADWLMGLLWAAIFVAVACYILWMAVLVPRYADINSRISALEPVAEREK